MIASLHKLVNLVANSQKSIQGKRLLRQVLSPLYVKWSVAVTSKNCRLKCWLPFLEFCNLYWLLTFFFQIFLPHEQQTNKALCYLNFLGNEEVFLCVCSTILEWMRPVAKCIHISRWSWSFTILQCAHKNDPVSLIASLKLVGVNEHTNAHVNYNRMRCSNKVT